jgi:hypothetical protein
VAEREGETGAGKPESQKASKPLCREGATFSCSCWASCWVFKVSLLLAPARFGCLLVEALLGAANSLSCIVLTCFAMLEYVLLLLALLPIIIHQLVGLIVQLFHQSTKYIVVICVSASVYLSVNICQSLLQYPLPAPLASRIVLLQKVRAGHCVPALICSLHPSIHAAIPFRLGG